MTKRVLVAEFMHETNTFSVQSTDEEAFQEFKLLYRRRHPACLRRHEDVARRGFRGGARSSTGTSCIRWPTSANPSGRVTDACFEALSSRILDACDGVDGVLLHLHGSMSTQSHDDGEGELLLRLRKRVGADTPIVAVLDLHATVTQLMADNANALISYRTYPHIDQYERTWQAAELLEKAMAGEVTPQVALARRPILYALDGGRTTSPPFMELLRRGDQIELAGKALVVSVQAGFSSADVHDIGPSVAVTGNDLAAAQAIAEELMDYAWEQRTFSSIHFTPLAEAIAQAKAGTGQAKPLVIADYSDNPGSGAYGDATSLLKAVLDADLQNVGFHAICDPQAVLEAQAAGVGNQRDAGARRKSRSRPWAADRSKSRPMWWRSPTEVSSPMVRWEAVPGAITA